MPVTFVVVASEKVRDADRQKHAVDRRARPVLAQKTQKAFPLGLVQSLIALLCRIAPRGVEKDGFVGEPPIAVARAANASNGRLPELIRKRKFETRIHERSRLSRAGCSDEYIPGHLIDVPAVEQSEEALASTIDTALLEGCKRGVEAL